MTTEHDDTVEGERFLVTYKGSFDAEYLRQKVETGEIVYARQYYGETALQCAARDYMEDMIKAVHG